MANSFTALSSAILSWTNNTTSDELTAETPGIIRRSQLTMSRDLHDILALKKKAVATGVAGDPFINLPSSAILVDAIAYSGTAAATGSLTYIQRKELQYCREFWPDRTETTVSSRYFAHWDEDTLFVVGTPSTVHVYELEYTERLAYLSAANETNWFTDHAEDALFNLSVSNAYEFLQDQPRAERFYAYYAESLNAIRVEAGREKIDLYTRRYPIQTQ